MTDIDQSDRAQRFLADVADVQAGRADRQARLGLLGAVLLIAGVAVTFVAFLLSQSTDNSLDQATDISFGLFGLALSLAGVVLYLRHSFAEFLRFWMLRLIHEQQRDRSG
jgi:hypothetical protein